MSRAPNVVYIRARSRLADNLATGRARRNERGRVNRTETISGTTWRLRRSVALIGLMGCGKTTVGGRLAALIGAD